MVDILANGQFGRDDFIKCRSCAGKTFLVDDQGQRLQAYECDKCGATTQVQFEIDDEEEHTDAEWAWEYREE